MENRELWSAVVGILLPAVIAVVKQADWSKAAKTVAALLVCVLAGAVTAYFDGALTPTDLAKDVMVIILAAQTAYRAFWKPSGIDGAIERATTIGGVE